MTQTLKDFLSAQRNLVGVAGFDLRSIVSNRRAKFPIRGIVHKGVFADPAGGSYAEFCAGLRAPSVRDFRLFSFTRSYREKMDVRRWLGNYQPHIHLIAPYISMA
jgi:hypothetical protein